MSTVARLLLIWAAILAAGSSAECAGFRYSLWLRAHPQAVVADGRSETTVSAEVRDSNGRTAPDGTIVEFTTSLGTVDRSARTTAGVARVRLRADTTVGTAVVSAVVTTGNAVATVRVDFLEPGTELFDESFISIASKKHLGCDIGARIIDSAGGVSIYHRGLSIEAEEAQIDVAKNILRAKPGSEPIRIKRGDKELLASALYYDLTSMNGVIITPADDGARRLRFRGRDFHSEPDDDPDKRVTFDFTPISQATMFVKARSIFIRPGEEIKFKRASFYLEGDRVLSVPLHVEPLRGDRTSVNRMLTYGTDGLRLNIPFYYSLTPNAAGALRLRHSQGGGWGYYSGRSGWQLDLEQEYNFGGSTEGMLSVNRITSEDWGVRWNQRKEFDDDSTLYTYLDFPAHRSLYASADYSRTLGDYTLSLNLRGNRFINSTARYSTSAYLQSRPKQLIGGALSYSLTTRLGYDSYLGMGSNKLGGGLGLQLYGKPIVLGPSSSINTSLSANRDFGGIMPGTSVNANVGYYTGLGRIGQLGLNYTYSSSDAAFGFSQQRLSADLSLAPSDKWRAYLYGTFGIGDSSTSAFGELSYSFLPTWRIHLLGTFQKFAGFNYTDAEIALCKAIGKQEARLIWSKSRNRLRFEFSALSF